MALEDKDSCWELLVALWRISAGINRRGVGATLLMLEPAGCGASDHHHHRRPTQEGMCSDTLWSYRGWLGSVCIVHSPCNGLGLQKEIIL